MKYTPRVKANIPKEGGHAVFHLGSGLLHSGDCFPSIPLPEKFIIFFFNSWIVFVNKDGLKHQLVSSPNILSTITLSPIFENMSGGLGEEEGETVVEVWYMREEYIKEL